MPKKGKKAICSKSSRTCAVESEVSTDPPQETSPIETEEQVIENTASSGKETDFMARKTLARTLTQDEEDDVIAWLRENSFLFDKTSSGLKLKEKKKSTWAAKEAELGLRPGDLSSIWYPNMTTQYSKLIKCANKSGSGAAERTARQQWILDSFAFLRSFLVQLRTQRGSKFAEKRKELTLEESEDDDDDSSAVSISHASEGSHPKSARILSSLMSELETVRGAITTAQDAPAQTGQFLVYLMRQMVQQRMDMFVTQATRLALDLMDESSEERRRLAGGNVGQQDTTPVFAEPFPPTPSSGMYRRQAPVSAAFGSVEQQKQFQQQDFQMATNIAASAPPAHLTPQLKWFAHL